MGKNFAIYPSNKGLKSRICKELKQIYKKKNKQSHMSSKEDIYAANKYVKKMLITGHYRNANQNFEIPSYDS